MSDAKIAQIYALTIFTESVNAYSDNLDGDMKKPFIFNDRRSII